MKTYIFERQITMTGWIDAENEKQAREKLDTYEGWSVERESILLLDEEDIE